MFNQLTKPKVAVNPAQVGPGIGTKLPGRGLCGVVCDRGVLYAMLCLNALLCLLISLQVRTMGALVKEGKVKTWGLRQGRRVRVLERTCTLHICTIT